MTWHARDSIALVELIFYIPFALLSIFVCYRHGFHQSSGWIYTLILCIVRIIGSICQFVQDQSQSTSLLETVLVLDSVGLSPLLLATLGLLSRFVNFINTKSTPNFTLRHFRILQLVIVVGLILGIVGGTSTTYASGTYQTPVTSKVGVILYIVGFVGLIIIFILSTPKVSRIPSRERRVPLVVALALPFIFVRLIYSILSVFLHNHLFSTAAGSVPVRITMSLIEEFIVVSLYASLGLLVDKLDTTTQGPIASRPWIGKKSKNSQQAHDYNTLDAEVQNLGVYPATVPPAHSQSKVVAR